MIPYGKQEIIQEDIDAVVSVLQSDFLTQGPQVPAFEKSLTDFTGAEHALAVNSATSALHIACLALELGAGDILWTSPITFVASANCGLYCGAEVDFVDIDAATYNLCPVKLEEKLLSLFNSSEFGLINVSLAAIFPYFNVRFTCNRLAIDAKFALLLFRTNVEKLSS